MTIDKTPTRRRTTRTVIKDAKGRPVDLEVKAAVPAVAETGNLMPAYLRDKAPVNLGIDASDIILPRIKLLQGISPEVEAHEQAKAGVFWHNILGERITSEAYPEGNGFEFIIASFRKKYLLMAPISDPRGVLARAEDGVHWSPPDQTFEVKLKGVKEPQKWTTKATVKESGLDQFGSSVAGDPDSVPAAVLVYEFLVCLPDRPDLSPIVMSLARSAAKRGKDLLSKITFRNAPLAGMRFRALVTEETGDEGPYKNYQFQNAGWSTEEQFSWVEGIAAKYTTYKVADEEGAAGAEADAKAAGKTEF
jgi:hypothetical protein